MRKIRNFRRRFRSIYCERTCVRRLEHEDPEIVAGMEDATHGFQGWWVRGEAGGEKARDSYADAQQRENRMFDVTYQYGILAGVMWGPTDVKRDPQRRPPSSPAEYRCKDLHKRYGMGTENTRTQV